MTLNQQRAILVLSRLMDRVGEDHCFADYICDTMDDYLWELNAEDQFGTEGQNDPRGDYRGTTAWSMLNVQGVDG